MSRRWLGWLADQGHVDNISYEASSGHLTGTLKKGAPSIDGKTAFSTQTKPDGIPDADLTELKSDKVQVNYQPKPSNLVGTILSFVLVIALIGMPVVLGYTLFIYSRFRGPVVLDDHSY